MLVFADMDGYITKKGGIMKVQIIHDSEKGNGRKMAERLAAELEARGAAVTVGHRSELTPAHTAENPPDLLIVGAAVRKFFLSPPIKKWISTLGGELEKRDVNIPFAAVFLTHVMPDKMVEGRAARLQGNLSRVSRIGEVRTEWLSGQVSDIPGPFIDENMENAVAFAADLSEWAAGKS